MPVLAYPGVNKPFVVNIDASEQTLGNIVYQRQLRTLHAIAYSSRSSIQAEENCTYHKGKLGLLALKRVNCTLFRDTCIMKTILLCTHNHPLT